MAVGELQHDVGCVIPEASKEYPEPKLCKSAMRQILSDVVESTGTPETGVC